MKTPSYHTRMIPIRPEVNDASSRYVSFAIVVSVFAFAFVLCSCTKQDVSFESTGGRVLFFDDDTTRFVRMNYSGSVRLHFRGKYLDVSFEGDRVLGLYLVDQDGGNRRTEIGIDSAFSLESFPLQNDGGSVFWYYKKRGKWYILDSNMVSQPIDFSKYVTHSSSKTLQQN